MLSSILICAEVTGHYKGRMKKEGEGGMVVKTYKKWEGDVGPCETHLSLLTGAYQSQPPALPHRMGDRGPIFRDWLEQTANSFGSLGFSQAATLRGLGSS